MKDKAATIIGAGIVGPMAALVLTLAGYIVNVFEARPKSDLHSDGILGITDLNWQRMLNMGVDLCARELSSISTDETRGITKSSGFHHITWTDLHNALVERAEEAGAFFRYATQAPEFESAPELINLRVVATGVGTAKEVSTPDYTGYVVMRGLAYQFSGSSWTTSHGEAESGPYEFNAGDTRDGTSVALFVKRDSVQMRTTYTTTPPPEIDALSLRWKRLLETVPLWQIAPLSDWEVPRQMVDDTNSIRIGDANGQMRPQTSMGANLGLMEAFDVISIYASQNAERNHLIERGIQHDRGIHLGIQRDKFSFLEEEA